MNIFRSLWRSSGFLAAAVLTLALGIGVNVACFGVVRAVLLKPLGYRNPDRIVLLSGGASPVHYSEIRSAAREFSSIGAYAMEEDLAFAGGTSPHVLKTNRVSAHFLDILGISPLLGRSLSATENTALISYEFWQREFHGDFQVVGRPIDLGGNTYSISGVLPPNFAFPAPGIDVWMANPEDSPQFPPPSRALSPFLTVFGRLRPGVTLDQATAELIVLQGQYARSHPAMLDAKRRFLLLPLR
jgi:putative ABC transport system permease protein